MSSNVFSSIWCLVACFFVAGVIALAFWRCGYQEGQIDALTGKIVYELVVQPDSTRKWEKVK